MAKIRVPIHGIKHFLRHKMAMERAKEPTIREMRHWGDDDLLSADLGIYWDRKNLFEKTFARLRNMMYL